jgi:dTDP-4-dehydrorhamnose reductase
MTTREIMVLGAGGQVGRALVEALGPRAIALGRSDADYSRPTTLPAVLDRFKPAAVINAAAYTQVDRAESEYDEALRVNGEAPGILAGWCAAHDVPLVHYSTDYVFPGTGFRPWTETDAVGPLNAYGRTKLEGERRVAAAGGQWLIFRTSWVYDAIGRNFFTTMLRLGQERETLSVVADQHGAPTYAPHLAEATLRALERAMAQAEFPSGIYHLCHGGETTWHGFSEAIFAGARYRAHNLRVESVRPIASSEYPTPAKRPLNSRLDTSRALATFGVQLPHWLVGLDACLARLAL